MADLDGYKILNIENDFKSLEVPQATFSRELNGIGEKDFFVFEYDNINVIVDGHLFSLGLNGRNPILKGETVLYVDENNDLWYGRTDES